MSKLLQIAGIVFVAIGVALWLMVFLASASLQVRGISADTATLFLVGGVLAAGIGSVISALNVAPRAPVYAEAPARRAETASAGAAATAAASVAVAEAHDDLSPEVSETIKALDQAKSDLRQAFDEKPAAEPPHVEEAAVEPEPEPEPEPAEEVAEDDGQLYVLEEKVIRGHPARVLSDGTVEAETAEGWMRFENLEHLDEYLDAMEPSA